MKHALLSVSTSQQRKEGDDELVVVCLQGMSARHIGAARLHGLAVSGVASLGR